jgi:hypothetical protein
MYQQGQNYYYYSDSDSDSDDYDDSDREEEEYFNKRTTCFVNSLFLIKNKELSKNELIELKQRSYNDFEYDRFRGLIYDYNKMTKKIYNLLIHSVEFVVNPETTAYELYCLGYNSNSGLGLYDTPSRKNIDLAIEKGSVEAMLFIANKYKYSDIDICLKYCNMAYKLGSVSALSVMAYAYALCGNYKQVKEYALKVLGTTENTDDARKSKIEICSLLSDYYGYTNIKKHKMINFLHKMAEEGSFMSCKKANSMFVAKKINNSELMEAYCIYIINHEKENLETKLYEKDDYHEVFNKVIVHITTTHDIIYDSILYWNYLLYINKLISNKSIEINYEYNTFKYTDDDDGGVHYLSHLGSKLFVMIVKNFKILVDSLKIHYEFMPGGPGFIKAKEEYTSTEKKYLNVKK